MEKFKALTLKKDALVPIEIGAGFYAAMQDVFSHYIELNGENKAIVSLDEMRKGIEPKNLFEVNMLVLSAFRYHVRNKSKEQNSEVVKINIGYNFYNALKNLFYHYIELNGVEKATASLEDLKEGLEPKDKFEGCVIVLSTFIYEIEKNAQAQGMMEEVEIDPATLNPN